MGQLLFVTEVKDKLTESDRKSRTEVFDFIESELKAIENELKAPKTNQYGRVDQVAAWLCSLACTSMPKCIQAMLVGLIV